MANKKVPLRQCVGCMQMFSKKEMARIVRTPEGPFVLDQKGKQNGRGAYVCKKKECLMAARKTKGLDRSFHMSVPDEVYEQLLREFEADHEE